jgi:hypothetical protein
MNEMAEEMMLPAMTHTKHRPDLMAQREPVASSCEEQMQTPPEEINSGQGYTATLIACDPTATDKKWDDEEKRIFQVGDRKLTADQLYCELRVFEATQSNNMSEFVTAQPYWLELRAKDLEKIEENVTRTFQSSAMQLQTIVPREQNKIAAERGLQQLIAAHRSHKAILLRQTPETRRKYWSWVKDSGEPELFKKIDELDEAIIKLYGFRTVCCVCDLLAGVDLSLTLCYNCL